LNLEKRLLAPMVFLLIIIPSSLISIATINYMDQKIYSDKIYNELSFPGGKCSDYLNNNIFSNLLFECDIIATDRIDYSNGLTYNESYFQSNFNTAEELINITCESKSIQFIWSHEYYSGTPEAFHLSDLNKIAIKYRDYWSEKNTSVIHIIFIQGYYNTDPEEINPIDDRSGTTINSDTIFIFTPFVTSSTERGIYPFLSRDIAHEIGHLLGLVAPFSSSSGFNAPNATNHSDEQHPLHCITTQCLMNYSDNPYKGNLPCNYCLDDLIYLKNTSNFENRIFKPIVNWTFVILAVCSVVVGGVVFLVSKQKIPSNKRKKP
jgi:hypothetical protein